MISQNHQNLKSQVHQAKIQVQVQASPPSGAKKKSRKEGEKAPADSKLLPPNGGRATSGEGPQPHHTAAADYSHFIPNGALDPLHKISYHAQVDKQARIWYVNSI